MSKLQKIKKILSEAAKKLLPAVAGLAVGAVAGPPVGAIVSFVVSRLKPFNISVDPEKLAGISENLLQNAGNMAMGVLLEKIIKSEGEIGGKKIDDLIDEGFETIDNKIILAVESTVRPMMEGLEEGLAYLRENPKNFIENLKQIIGEENHQLLNELDIKLNSQSNAINNSINVLEDRIKIGIGTITENLKQIFEIISKNRSSPQKIIDKETALALCIEHTSSELMVSRYDIPYNPELYTHRSEAEHALSDFVRDVTSLGGINSNIFVLLSEIGVGKTWIMAHFAEYLSDLGFPTLFFELRFGIQDRIARLLGANSPHDAIFQVLTLHSVIQKPIFIILDGLDEIKSKGSQADLIEWIFEVRGNVGKNNVAFIVTSREYDWKINGSIKSLISDRQEFFYNDSNGRLGVSYMLNQFQNSEFSEVLSKYGIDETSLKSEKLKELMQVPFILRLLAEFRELNGIIPDPEKIEEFLPIFYDQKDPEQNNTILGRMGIRTDKIEVLETLMKCCYETENGLFIKKDALNEKYITEDDKNLFFSSGLVVKEFVFGALSEINSLYAPYIRKIAEMYNIPFLKGESESKDNLKPVDKPPIGKEPIEKSKKKYNWHMSLGNHDFEQKKYENALNQFKDAMIIAQDDLIEPSLFFQSEELFKKTQKIISEEKNYQDLYLQATELVKAQKWKEAIDLWETILKLSSDLFRISRKEASLKQIENCNKKIEEEEEKEKHEEFINFKSSAENLEENGDYIGSKSFWNQALEFSTREGWNDLQEEITKRIQYCDELILHSNENMNIVKDGDTAFKNEAFKQAISYFEQSKEICKQYGWQKGVLYADDMIEKCNNKIEEEEKLEKFNNLQSSAENLVKKGNYSESKSVWNQAFELSKKEGWNDLQKEITKHIQYCDELILYSNENMNIVKNGNTAFNNEEYDQSISYFEQSKNICEKYGWQDCIHNANEMIKICNEKLDGQKSVNYHGTMLVKSEYNFMIELEKLVGEPIPALSENKIGSTTFGFFTSNNHVIGLGINNKNLSDLPESIGSLKSLTSLHLSRNNIFSLPETIGSLTSLTFINLRVNNLSTLPEIITRMTWLKFLDIGINGLTSLPESIGLLKSLETLLLGFNKISFLPETIGSLTELTTLYLNDNQLSSLPETIGSLKSLTKLRLSYNKISFLPETIGSLTELTTLYLNDNQLSSLPETISSLKSLTYIDLKNNPLNLGV